MTHEHVWLVGRTVEIYLDSVESDDNPFSRHELIVFRDKCSGEYSCFEIVAECCSKSWIEHITGISCLSSPVTAVYFEPAPIDMIPGEAEYPCTRKRMYVYKIVTEAGVCDIELRNISTGAYSGNIVPWDKHYRLWPSIAPVTDDF